MHHAARHGPASCTSTEWPRRARWYAAERPLGPATIRTRLPLGGASIGNDHPSLAAASPREALDGVDAHRRVEVLAPLLLVWTQTLLGTAPVSVNTNFMALWPPSDTGSNISGQPPGITPIPCCRP